MLARRQMRTGTRVLPDEFPRHVRRSVPAGNEAGAVRHREHVCSWTVSSDGLPAERSASSGSTLSRLLVLLVALGGCTSSMRPMLEVPDVVQSNSWSCGVAVVQAVLQAHGIEGYQDDYARELGTTREAGTHPTRIVACDAACEKIQGTPDTNVIIKFGCPSVPPPQ